MVNNNLQPRKRVGDDKRGLGRKAEKTISKQGGQDRRRRRQTTADIEVPQKLANLKALIFCLRAIDVFAITTLIALTVGLNSGYIGINGKPVIAPIAASLLGALIFLTSLFSLKAHEFAAKETYGDHLKKIFIASMVAIGLWLTTALILKPLTFRPDTLAIAGVVAMVGITVLHTIYYSFARSKHKIGALTPTIVMLGATDSARRLIEENARSRELNILAIFDERLSKTPLNIHGVPVIGNINALLEWDQLPYIDRIVVTLPGKATKRKTEFVKRVHKLPNRVAFVSDNFENFNHVQQRLTDIASISLRDTGPHKPIHEIVLKRVTDFTLSGIALLLLSPVLLLIALLIKLDSPGPILFRQPRHGFNNRIFEVLKFRSMKIEDEDKKAAQQVTAGDNRVTKLGRFIRNTSLDELPQLINVLRGDMSLVGPRPHAVGMRTGETESYKLVEEYAHRHRVKPGITGWAQINGSRGPLHNAQDVRRRVELDIEYIERSSFLFDIMIMIKTLPCLLGDSENIR